MSTPDGGTAADHPAADHPAAYRRRDDAVSPPFAYEPYGSTRLRAPSAPRVPLEQGLSELTGPGHEVGRLAEDDTDLTTNAGTGGEAIGERIIVTGQLRDEDGMPLAGELVEIWQPNAAGRYAHDGDQHPAPLDPHFVGQGRCVSDATGTYRFTTVRPGAYPWRNHPNAWRPSHIHFSVFGPAFTTRLITQMYFPGDPLHDLDPILCGVPAAHRHRLVAAYDHDITIAEWALGFRFDIVLRGPEATPYEATGAAALA